MIQKSAVSSAEVLNPNGERRAERMNSRGERRSGYGLVLFGLLLAAAFAPPIFRELTRKPFVFALPAASVASVSSDRWQDIPPMAVTLDARLIADPSPTGSVHAASLTELSDGRLLAVWFGGSREGARDVVIYQSQFHPDAGSWSDPAVLAGPSDVRQDLGRSIRKVGNPVVMTDRDGQVWIFFVTVSVGGWSGSAVNLKTSTDDGRTWTTTRRLVTSPFLNISTLVRCPPFQMADGTIALPVYHECLGKFSELLHLSREGAVLDKIRLTHGRQAIQPSIVSLDARRAIALHRNGGHRSRAVLCQFTDDGGNHWSKLAPLELPNANNSLAGVRLRSGMLLLAYNHSQTGRENLSLALSEDEGQSWRQFRVIENEPVAADGRKAEFSYPSLLQTVDGRVHLVYTWRRTHIKHVFFDMNRLDAWRQASSVSDLGEAHAREFAVKGQP